VGENVNGSLEATSNFELRLLFVACARCFWRDHARALTPVFAVLSVVLLCALFAVSVCSPITKADTYVLNALALRDEPTGESTGPKSFHDVSNLSAKSKHQPFIAVEGTKDGVVSLSVRVRGDAPQDNPDSLHPMSEAHFIEAIFVLDQDTDSVIFFHQFKPSADDTPVVRFTVPVKDQQHTLVPYEFCNLHGLWRGPSLTVGAEGAAEAAALASERAI